MFPQIRTDGVQMSPMQLEMLARGEGFDGEVRDFSPRTLAFAHGR